MSMDDTLNALVKAVCRWELLGVDMDHVAAMILAGAEPDGSRLDEAIFIDKE